MDSLIKQAEDDIANILDLYSNWWHKIEYGEASYSLYHDLIEFVNERMETIDACRILLKNKHVADALGLNRVLLENYLLYMLMCRGKKYFRIRQLKKSQNPDKILDEDRKNIGTNGLVDIQIHPRHNRTLLYIFEGLKLLDDDSIIPYHCFSIKKFDPESMRLDSDGYFTYRDGLSDTVRANSLQRKKDQSFMYQHYLSYSGLLDCLRINEIIDDTTTLRIQAHYTYLGEFVHPTHEASHKLRQHKNYRSNRTVVGAEYQYEPSAILMAYNYTIYNAIGYIEELASVIDHAPTKSIKNSGSKDIHQIIRETKKRHTYFWYIFNDPPDYAKFEYTMHHISDTDFKAMDKDYRKINPKIVTFDKNIYDNFQRSMDAWSNKRVGPYDPPSINH